ncbi:hypothetical protein [Mucilaginibacter auburnensis]|uniref:Uncharacterized protein n=1 Tax=Mucilaginibacter auburnensis TaxID=1457233 RepID=A0A2H9VLC2_9SPHI|nr:hypothetical protein [Mucilaginibacter auburnensis]PJJ79139.1 hypothetical protein CLV57_2264 [Mucilaginibacter auburnensis]
MSNTLLYIVGIFVVIMIYLLAFGGAAMVGGKFDRWRSRTIDRTKRAFKWKRKGFQRY